MTLSELQLVVAAVNVVAVIAVAVLHAKIQQQIHVIETKVNGRLSELINVSNEVARRVGVEQGVIQEHERIEATRDQDSDN